MGNNLVLDKFETTQLVNIGTERDFLASVIQSEEAWQRVPQDFEGTALSVPLNRTLWEIVDKTWASSQRPDLMGLHAELPDEIKKELDELGGFDYLRRLQGLPVDPYNTTARAEELLELETLRRVKEAGSNISKLPDQIRDVPQVMERIEDVIGSISRHQSEHVIPIGEGGFELVQSKMSNPQDVPGLSSGFESLDRILLGFQPARMYAVGARTNIGKSIILLNWAKHMAVDSGVPILWITTEHSHHDDLLRLISLVSQVPYNLIESGKVAEIPAFTEQVVSAVVNITNAPFMFCAMPNFSLDKIRRTTRRYARVTPNVKALFFDYIKNEESSSPDKEYITLGNLAFGLKALSEQEKIPVMTAVQFNREGAQAQKFGNDPDDAHVAGSDRIVHAASVFMSMRKPTDKEGDYLTQRILTLSKNRHGSLDYRHLISFRGETIRMKEQQAL